MVRLINQSLEERKYCTSVFLDIAQAFDKVWHPGLLYKIKKNVPNDIYENLKSYLQDRHFIVKQQVYGVYGTMQGAVRNPTK